MADNIVHDAEYYVVEVQNEEKWAAEDADLDARLAELREKHGTPPNIIHIMFDDLAFGDLGIPQMAAIRGFNTPNIDRMAREGAHVYAHVYGACLYAQPRGRYHRPAPGSLRHGRGRLAADLRWPRRR